MWQIKMFSILLHFLVVFSIIPIICAYNFNTLHSIIYEDAHKRMGIDVRKSLFGYTTALYSGKIPSIFIGAPKGQDISIPAENPGVVFKCGIKRECNMLALDDTNDIGASIGKDNSWIGGTMDINADANLLAICGFRWTIGSNMIGACYTSKIDKPANFIKLLPLGDPNKVTLHFTNSSVYFYGFGQAGFSAHFTSEKQNPNLLLGAPGLLNWYGGTALYSNLNSPYLVQHKVARQQINYFALFGYAVSSGRYTGDGKLYVSSAPKGNKYLGAVILYKFGPNDDSFIEPKYKLSGSQIGEYFGAALLSGDLNNDGYDDLVIGAPFYKEANFNDGRVHVYYGGKDRNDFAEKDNVVHIMGSSDGGQFGIAMQFLGDINLDGYGDIAVGEPYGNSHRGRVFIYHGGMYGLQTTPVQILEAENIDNNLRGFGISISKAVDIDGNGYPDIAVGSHLSGQVVLLRSNPLIEIDSSLQIKNGTKIQIGNTTIMHCYTHSGSPYIPKHLLIRRKLIIDQNYQRVVLASFTQTQMEREFELKNDCELFVLTTKEKLYYLTEPVKVSVSYELVQEPPRKSNYYVGISNNDTFCKTCPVLLNVRPLETEFSFALGCGDDDVCTSNLSFDAKFFDLENNTFIVGSTDIIRMEVLIVNSGDSAYLTQMSVTLPKNVRFNSILPKCSEDEPGTLVCPVGNPLNNQVYAPVFLNMKDVRTDFGSNLNITVNVTTTSENKNPEKHKHFTIFLKDVVDLKLSAKAEPTWLYYTNNATFKQVFQIQKIGHSPAEQVSITINLPTHIVKDNITHSIIKLYSLLGSLRGQDVLCQNHSQVEYVEKTDIMETVDTDIIEPLLLRRRRDIDSNIVYTNNLNDSISSTMDFSEAEEDLPNNDLLNGKSVTLDCRDTKSPVICTKFSCNIGTIKSEQDVGVVRIDALIDIDAVKKFLKVENSVLLTSFAHVDAAFEIDTESNNDIDVTTTFLNPKGFTLDLWIILCAVLAGLLLLMIITCILYKCGFFKRNNKLQLEEEKKQAAAEEFQDARLNGEDPAELNVETCDTEVLEEMEMKMEMDEKSQPGT